MKKVNQTSFNQEEIAFYLKDLRKYPLISIEEERALKDALSQLKKSDDPTARAKIATKLVESNLRFVLTIAKEYQGNGLDLPDIIQEGNIGLIKACERYDPTVEVKFISYAVHWVRQAIKQSLNEKSRTIRIPVNIVTDINKSKNVTDKDKRELQEIYAEDLETAYASCVSLDESIDDRAIFEDGNTLLDILANPNAELPDDGLEEKDDLKGELQKMLKILDQRELFIIESYFGLTGSPTTLEDIGKELSPELTKERVRQIRDKALKKLRNESETLFQYR
jgi:RNA polymerase primary sigma factor